MFETKDNIELYIQKFSFPTALTIAEIIQLQCRWVSRYQNHVKPDQLSNEAIAN